MAFQDDLDLNPIHPVTARAVNEKGGTYFVKIAMKKKEAGEFLMEMWGLVDPMMKPSDEEQSLHEWTDRMRDVRSSFSSYDGICIRTHAWHPQGDTQTLDPAVLSFLQSKGYIV
jgi:hypothetical protein